MKIKAAIIQMRVDEDKQKNIDTANEYFKNAVKEGIDIAILPEMFCCPYETPNFPIYAEREGGECYRVMANFAKEYGIYLVAGSMPEKDENNHIFNTSYVFNRKGEKIAKHRKMHLFDIDVAGRQRFKESDTLTAGNEITVFDTEFGKIGLCICYDIRFPELSRLMVDQEAKVIIVPGAFNMTTGPAHWNVLFRNRALDNQVFMIGCAPARDLSASYTSYGHSIAVSPWGEIVQQLDEKEGYMIVELNLQQVEKVRRELPLLKQRRNDLYTLKSL
ncbi:carbon-nitrogen hydrolase family protein [Virgibacillus sp. 6R]|uniref:carbon-nitrogen hydrolase family protein n=1 Tax=Metabacillus sp. 22489 TaxID=3453928 RepID=UPI001C92DC36